MNYAADAKLHDVSTYTGVEFIRGVTAIASAFLQKNQVPAHEVATLIRGISKELKDAVIAGADIDKISQIGEISEQAAEADVAFVETVVEKAVPTVDPRRLNLPTVPFVPISESVKPHVIVCLFDGVEKKMLKRYIRAKFGMEEAEYRAYWGLPDDYPMVAPSYAEEKRCVAKTQGLGTSRVDKTPRVNRSEEHLLKVA